MRSFAAGVIVSLMRSFAAGVIVSLMRSFAAEVMVSFADGAMRSIAAEATSQLIFAFKIRI